MKKTWDSNLYKGDHSYVFKYGENLIELLNPQKDQNILDIGSGTGELTSKISSLSKSIVGIDSSSDMIENSKSNFPNIDFILADALTYKGKIKFDSIFSNACLHWIINHDGLVKNINYNLKTGGSFVAEFGGKGNISNITTSLLRNIKKIENIEIVLEESWQFPSISKFTSLLEKNGFEVKLATLFPRKTKLESSNGIRNWIEMFAAQFLEDISEANKEKILELTENDLKSSNFENGIWYADYKRIRIKAIKINNDL